MDPSHSDGRWIIIYPVAISNIVVGSNENGRDSERGCATERHLSQASNPTTGWLEAASWMRADLIQHKWCSRYNNRIPFNKPRWNGREWMWMESVGLLICLSNGIIIINCECGGETSRIHQAPANEIRGRRFKSVYRHASSLFEADNRLEKLLCIETTTTSSSSGQQDGCLFCILSIPHPLQSILPAHYRLPSSSHPTRRKRIKISFYTKEIWFLWFSSFPRFLSEALSHNYTIHWIISFFSLPVARLSL